MHALSRRAMECFITGYTLAYFAHYLPRISLPFIDISRASAYITTAYGYTTGWFRYCLAYFLITCYFIIIHTWQMPKNTNTYYIVRRHWLFIYVIQKHTALQPIIRRIWAYILRFQDIDWYAIRWLLGAALHLPWHFQWLVTDYRYWLTFSSCKHNHKGL